MAIAKISGRGLLAISLAVALLWGCFIAEQLTIRHARTERATTMAQLRALRRQRMQPVSTPMPHPSRPVRPVAG